MIHSLNSFKFCFFFYCVCFIWSQNAYSGWFPGLYVSSVEYNSDGKVERVHFNGGLSGINSSLDLIPCAYMEKLQNGGVLTYTEAQKKCNLDMEFRWYNQIEGSWVLINPSKISATGKELFDNNIKTVGEYIAFMVMNNRLGDAFIFSGKSYPLPSYSLSSGCFRFTLYDNTAKINDPTCNRSLIPDNNCVFDSSIIIDFGTVSSKQFEAGSVSKSVSLGYTCPTSKKLAFYLNDNSNSIPMDRLNGTGDLNVQFDINNVSLHSSSPTKISLVEGTGYLTLTAKISGNGIGDFSMSRVITASVY